LSFNFHNVLERGQQHIKESYECRSITAWNDLLDVWAWKPEAQARNKFHAFFMQSSQMDSLHIGNMIRAELKAQGRTVTWFAKAIHTTRTNVYKIMDKESIDLKLLIRISKLLHYDFLSECSKAYRDEPQKDTEV
jgi:hypothetical protein